MRSAKTFGVEVDALPGGYVCSGAFKGELGTGDVKKAMTGSHPLHKLFSKEQRAFFAAHAPESIELDDLSVLGPVHVLKLKCSPEGYDRRLVEDSRSPPSRGRTSPGVG